MALPHGKLLSIGDHFPQFTVPAVVSLEKGREFTTITSNNLDEKWSIIFYWVMNFTPICPKEIAEFNKIHIEFEKLGAQVFGFSCDSQHSHLAWKQQTPELQKISFPMLSDYKRDVAEHLGIIHPIEKVPLRATYIVDPYGIIRWISVSDIKIPRNVNEVLRNLVALQKEEQNIQTNLHEKESSFFIN